MQQISAVTGVASELPLLDQQAAAVAAVVGRNSCLVAPAVAICSTAVRDVQQQQDPYMGPTAGERRFGRLFCIINVVVIAFLASDDTTAETT